VEDDGEEALSDGTAAMVTCLLAGGLYRLRVQYLMLSRSNFRDRRQPYLQYKDTLLTTNELAFEERLSAIYSGNQASESLTEVEG
jgi:hypothetical protein